MRSPQPARLASRFGCFLSITLFAACADGSAPTLAEGAEELRAAKAAGVPTRAQEDPDGFTSLSDSALWAYVARTDSTMVAGLRAPGTPRGVWRGDLLLSRTEWRNARNAVLAQRGITLLGEDDLLPAIRIKVTSAAALTAVRKLPIVDYLEPTHVEAVGNGLASDCGDSGSPWPGNTTVASGDIVHPTFKEMGMELAWRRSTGAGVMVGLIDTGLSINQPELMNLASTTEGFTSGESDGRTVETMTGYDASCSHGTRMAAVIAAPKNGFGAVGVAYKASLADAHHANDVWGLFNAIDGWMSANRIRWSVQQGSKVISMAFMTSSSHSYLADEIRLWHANSQILFVGAAGTSTGRANNVVFPAELPEVFAVTGVDRSNPNISCSKCHYGSKVALSAYIYQATHGMQAGTMTDINGSSVATALISGVAALLYSRHPGITRGAVIDKLQRSGHLYPNRSSHVGYGVVNAMKALGGLYGAVADGETDLLGPEGGVATGEFGLQAFTGDSPGTVEYGWHNGANTPLTTFQFQAPAYGETVTYYLHWYVRTPSDGTVISGQLPVRVSGCSYMAGTC